MNEPVRLYLRVQNQDEVCMGTARSMGDIPLMLEEIAAMFRGRFAAEIHRDQSVSGCACLVDDRRYRS